MLSKNKIKYIRSLELKKKRKEEKVFVAEGPKLVEDLLGAFHCKMLVATEKWIKNHAEIKSDETIIASEEELSRASFLKTPQEVLAVLEQPCQEVNWAAIQRSLCLGLDDIQDPGNLGTIVRLADWFGIEHIFCSPDTVDIYSPKAIQATMGGIVRVKLHYGSLTEVIRHFEGSPVYGTFLKGENIYKKQLTNYGLIIMGNEGKGIGREIEKEITEKLYVPNYPQARHATESLNVAVATAVICAEFRRQALFPNTASTQ